MRAKEPNKVKRIILIAICSLAFVIFSNGIYWVFSDIQQHCYTKVQQAVLASRYPNISATLNPVENVLLLEYAADICTVEEFDRHFNDAISEIEFVLEFYMQRLEHVFKAHFRNV